MSIPCTENGVDHMPVLLHRTLTGQFACGVVVSSFERTDRATQGKSISTWSAQVCRTFSTAVLCPPQQVATSLWSSLCRQRQQANDNARPGTTLAGPRGWPTTTVSQTRMAPRETDGGRSCRGLACYRIRHRSSLAAGAPFLAIARLPGERRR